MPSPLAGPIAIRSSTWKGALPPVKHRHYASITYPSEVGGLLRAIDGYQGKSRVVQGCAARCRSRSSSFDPASCAMRAGKSSTSLKAQWKIPAERMKRPFPHIVPLSKQSDGRPARASPVHRSHGTSSFPGIRSGAQPISENTVNAAATPHGIHRRRDDRPRIPFDGLDAS